MQVAYSGTGGKVRRYSCVARPRAASHRHQLPDRSAAAVWRKRSSHAFLEAVTPAGGDRDRRRDPRARGPASSSCSPASASRWSAPNMRPSEPSASSTRASPRTGSSPARWNASSRTRSPRSSARTPEADRARARPAPTLHRRRARTRSARHRPQPSAAVGGGHDNRSRPQAAAAHADRRDRRDRRHASSDRPPSRSPGKAAHAPS